MIPKVTDAEFAFGTTSHLPKMEDIPKEFKEETSKWNTLFDKMFYGNTKDVDMIPKAGVDPHLALRFITAHMKSFDPQHEHKRAACSFMFSQYFDDWRTSK